MRNHFDINPIKAYINTSQIVSKEAIKQKNLPEVLPCTIIGVCTYINETLTALIKLDNGVVYDYIPFSALNAKEKVNTSSVLEAHFCNCPSLEISVQEIEPLKGVVYYTDREKKVWKKASYLMSFDFVNANEFLNLLIDESTGNFVLRPLHKVLFNPKEAPETVDIKMYIKQPNKYIIK